MSNQQQKRYSFESLFNYYVAATAILLLSLLGVIFYNTSASLLIVITTLLLTFVPFLLLSWLLKNAIKTPLFSLSAALEAIRNEDYSLRTSPKFNDGAIKTLSDEVTLMANDLRVRKLHYDQHAVLVLNLIKQLAMPIAVFDKEGRLNHANDAFSSWCGTPWQQIKYSNANSLGFSYSPENLSANENADSLHFKWQLTDKHLATSWQLRYSQITMQDEEFQLVVLTNIEQLVHQTEQVAWHKMTRVLSHEINNSLSPIKSLAQSLAEIFEQQSLDENAMQALNIIVSRSDSLMQFVNRYSSVTQEFDVNIENLDLSTLIKKVTTLFNHPFTLSLTENQILADRVLLEQTLINLIKNATEASPENSNIEIASVKKGKYIEIQITDSGAGISNPDNLFVPFYTTKESGKGIGLPLCRNMTERQGGKLALENRKDQNGAIATIALPQ